MATTPRDRKRKNQNEAVDIKNTRPSIDYVKAPLHSGQFDPMRPKMQSPNALYNPVTISTATRGKEFKRTVSLFSNEKIIAMLEMGFGPLYQFRCSKLNRALCQMLVDNFDVASSTIKIHGRHLAINRVDFQRVMGVRDGGCDVDLGGSLDDPDILEIRKKVFGNPKEISIDVLRKALVEAKTADDTFRICFSLYAMSTLLFPNYPGHVDARYLLAVKDPSAIHMNNWATLGFTMLLEGISLFQRTRHPYMGGCLVFLQLFYLDAVAYSLCIVPKSAPPVMTWGIKEAKRLYDRVEEVGGFHCDNIYVTKRFSGARTEAPSDSIDVSTGMKTNFHDELTQVKANVCGVESNLTILSSTVGTMQPDIVWLKGAIGALEKALEDLASQGVGNIVAGVMTRLFSSDSIVRSRQKHEPETTGKQDKPQTFHSHSPVLHNDSPMKEEAAGRDSFNGCEGMLSGKRLPVGACHTVSDLSNNDFALLKYLFGKKMNPPDILLCDEVARLCEFRVSLWDISCLSPSHCLTREVVNISAAYLNDLDIDCWFLPSLSSDAADKAGLHDGDSQLMSTTMTMCGLRTHRWRLKHLRQIYIPIHDTVDNHWFLLVVNMGQADCEIWDSNPHPQAKDRRKENANAAILLLQNVLANDLKMSLSMYVKFGSFSISYPECVPRHHNNHDSGIYVIRNMQFKRDHWDEGFNSADQRVRLALEIVKHPKNEVYDRVKLVVASDDLLPHKNNGKLHSSPHQPDPDTETCPIQGMKFNPRRPRR